MLHTFFFVNEVPEQACHITTMMTHKYLGRLLCAVLLVFIGCQKAPELTLTSSSNIEFSADGSSGSITFTANQDWTARAYDSWVSVSPSSGTASDGPVTVTVRCNANTTYEDRSTTVTINMGDLSQTVSVKQPANKGIVLPKQVFDLQSDTRSIDVEVQANVQYSVSTSANWIKQVGTKALSSKILSFSIEENKTYDSREGKITIKPNEGNVQEQVITVRQAQKDALIVEKTSYDMPYGGGEVEIKVESNVSFDVTPNVDWLHYTQTKALSTSTVCIKVDENPTYSNREGKIEITQKNGSLKHTITVKQASRIAVSSVELNKTSLQVKEGDKETLIATVRPDNATDKKVTWSSSNTAYATVDETGKVTALKEGPVTITAKAGEKSATCTVTVYKEIPVTGIELDKTSLSLVAGNEISLVATVKPDNATDKTVSWTSSNENIVTINAEGKVKAVAKGNAIITAKTGNTSATCAVFVKAANYPTPSGAVDLGLSVVWGEKNLGASSMYDAGSYYLWGDPTGTGIIMYFETPSANYIVDTQYDIAKAKLGKGWRLPTREEIKELLSSCSWAKVSNGVRLTGPNGKSIMLPLTGMGFPADGAAGSMSITNKDKGYLMTGESYADGSTRFAYVYHYNQSFTYNWSSYNAPMAKFPVRPVFESLDGTIPVSSITLNKTELKIKEGASETLIATVLPSDATDKSITWSISDATIATVENGKVTAVKEGTATITARAGEKSAVCEVIVSSSVQEGNIAFADATLKNKLVDLFDSDGDGEISYKEAAAVTTLEDILGPGLPIDYTWQIKSFNEFRYFINVKCIPQNAFYKWKTLESIILPQGLTSIGQYAFNECIALTYISIPGSLTSVGPYAFNNCSSLSSITIPESVTTIGAGAFSGTSISTFSFPSKITSISEFAFSKCKKLITLNIPSSIKSIGKGAFYASGLTSIEIPSSVTSIGENAFTATPLKSIILPEGVLCIGTGTFESCTALESISIPNSVTSIGQDAFSRCSALASVTLPGSLNDLGIYAFYGCTALSTITIPNSLKSVSSYAFNSCSNLVEIVLQAETPPTIGAKCFDDTNNCPIKVPTGCVDDYKTAATWIPYSSRIIAY